MTDTSSFPEPATAVSELLIMLALAHHPVGESELEDCQTALSRLCQGNAAFSRLLASVTRLHLIEALGHLHTIISLDAARQKHARDLGKALAFLSPREKIHLCRIAEDFLRQRSSALGQDLYQTFLTRLA